MYQLSSAAQKLPQGVPGGPVVETVLPLQGAQVPSLVRELRSHRPWSTAKKKRKMPPNVASLSVSFDFIPESVGQQFGLDSAGGLPGGWLVWMTPADSSLLHVASHLLAGLSGLVHVVMAGFQKRAVVCKSSA